MSHKDFPVDDLKGELGLKEPLFETVFDPTDGGGDLTENTVLWVGTSHHARQSRRAGPVGGQSAQQADMLGAATHDRDTIIPIVLLVIFAVLALLLRAVVAPLLLVGTVVLSFGATLGVGARVFNDVFRFPGADPSIPLYAFVFLVALGIDYNIFLMTRAREESEVEATESGTLSAPAVTGGVITSAGVVLAATFAALSVLPVLFLAQVAFLVAFGAAGHVHRAIVAGPRACRRLRPGHLVARQTRRVTPRRSAKPADGELCRRAYEIGLESRFRRSKQPEGETGAEQADAGSHQQRRTRHRGRSARRRGPGGQPAQLRRCPARRP
jgi:hypothetical protein